VAHICNSSYSGGRDQEDRGSKPAWANSSQDPISKNSSHTHTHTHKTGMVEWLKVKALSSSSSTTHTQKKPHTHKTYVLCAQDYMVHTEWWNLAPARKELFELIRVRLPR
jgi:hypothetical protein